jgi:amino-acid N-acetyltransferase
MLRIEPASGDIFPEVVALLKAVSLPVSDLTRESMDEFLVARNDDSIAGAVALEPLGSLALLRSLSVRPDQQKNGVGRRLVDAALERAQTLGIHDVYLLTTTADVYFRQLGFGEIPRELVPAAVRGTTEFRSLCPQTAICMSKVV